MSEAKREVTFNEMAHADIEKAERWITSVNDGRLPSMEATFSLVTGLRTCVRRAQNEIAAIRAQEQPKNTGEVSDGYHTFNELYHHRAVLFSVICNDRSNLAWKSKRHSDGTMFDDMFIVGIETPNGQATYHYDIVPYWDMFNVPELDHAPEWDGHTPMQAVERIRMLAQEQNEPLTLEQVKQRKWVWIDGDTDLRNRGWAKVHAMYGLAKLEAVGYSFAKYGKTWIAYAREPEHAPLEGADK